MKVHIGTRLHSWAEQEISYPLDLNELLIHHKAATFFMRISGDGLRDAGIFADDIVIVDRSLSLAHNRLVVARLDGELVIKRIQINGAHLFLSSDTNAHEPIKITDERDFEVWGMVTYVIHRV